MLNKSNQLVLKEHQKIGVEFLSNKQYALLADDVGTGKTFTIIATLNVLKSERLLIVCPSSIKYQWLGNLEDLWHKKNFVYQVIDNSDEKLDEKADVHIINYDLIIKPSIYLQFFQKQYYDACILDESHRLKNLESQRTKILLTQYGIAKQAKKVYCVSGTPMTDHVIDFFPVLKTFAADNIFPYQDYYSFGERYCDGKKRRVFFGGKQKEIWECKGATNTKELQQKLQNFMLRRTASDITDCITCREEGTEIKFFESNKNIENIEMEELDRIENFLEEKESDLQAEDLLLLKQYTSIRNKVAQEKINICFFDLIEEIYKHKTVVIFTYHRAVAEKLKELLKDYDPIVIDGKDSAKKKYEKVKKFKAKKEEKKKFNILIGQVKAMGEGIDGLQLVCNHGIFFELSLTPADIFQAKARLIRMGQSAKIVSFSYYIIKGTIEETIFELVKNKWLKINRILKNKEN